ncbi:ATP-dependent sacrificial sulfur transferase LarE [Clostridium sp. BJN0001]|uniref:ATP-dependent sacrificial sulfur transferase LarE n=1 Tax=Clostridium sp. BJN0001 TaxID=2930219 RepID=UPI001FD3BAD7|nr:ATP-dependent sacrificial sulfur transferase LarE [Clostridium sp. BJN0001]
MISLEEKLKTLKSLIASYGSCAIAFSSGVDSTFLSYVTKEVLNDKAILISANVNTLTSRDTEDIISYSKNIGLKLITISCDQLAIDNFVKNPPKRCYFCKYHLFSKIKETAKKNGIDTVIDGTNASDCNDYRPGIKALEELNIKSPLKICGFTKKEIRDLLKAWNIDAFNKPSSGCLATRIPYFENITQEKLDIIRKCEDYLLNLGLTDIRVRLQNGTARIEVNPKNRSYFFNTSIMDNIYKTFISFGCSYVSLDLRGYKTGSLNEILDKGTNQNE